MEDLQRFLMEHLDLLFIFALVVLPLILGRRKKKPPKDPGRQADRTESDAAGKDRAKSLEEKVRKFFENMVEEASSPRPVARTPLSGPMEPEAVPAVPRPKAAPSRPPRPEVHDSLVEEGPAARKAKAANQAAARRAPPPGASEDFWAADIKLASPEDLDALPEELPPQQAKRLMKKLEDAYGGWETERPAPRESLDRYSVESLYHLSRADLKKAIVLKEILDPPVGLRE